MARHTNDMSQVAAPDDLVPEGNYLVRISEVKETVSESSGNDMAIFTCKIQDEGPAFGRSIPIFATLQGDKPNSLMILKAVYKACGYNPGPEGHDPSEVLDSEMYIGVQHEVYQGENRAKVLPYSIKSVTAGPHQRRR